VYQSLTWIGYIDGLDGVGLGQDFKGTLWIGMDWIGWNDCDRDL